MKTLIFFITLYHTLQAVDDDKQTSKSNLSKFMTSLFSVYSLSAQNVLECFDETSSSSFINFLQTVHSSLDALQTGNLTSFEDEYWKIFQLQDEFSNAFECAFQIHDFQIYIKYLGHEVELESSFEDLKSRFELFYFGNPNKLNNFIEIILFLLESGEADSVDLFFDDYIKEIYRYTFPRLNAINSWMSGIYKGLNLSPPFDLIDCMNKETDHKKEIENLYYFFYLWAGLATKSLPAFSLDTTEEYLVEAKKNFDTLLDSNIWNCMFYGPDATTMRRVLGFNLDPYDQSFRVLLRNYLKDNYRSAWTFQTVMGSLESDWKHGYYYQNGEDFAKFLMELRTLENRYSTFNFTRNV